MLEPMSRRRSLLHEARCQTCSLSSLCLPLALELDDVGQFDAIIRRRAPLKKGEPLFRQGDTFTSVYAVRSGSLKQITAEGNGSEQLTNFYLPVNWWGWMALTKSITPVALSPWKRPPSARFLLTAWTYSRRSCPNCVASFIAA